MEIKGVIFDLDGTLVDSRLDFGLIRREMGVPPGRPILEYLEELPDALERRRLLEILHRHEIEGARRATLIPGAMDFLKLLDRLEIRKAILTRNFGDATELVMERLSLKGFSPILTRENAKPKPDPDGLLKICENWALQPTETLFIGDYKFDLMAGKAAGIPTVLFTEESPTPAYSIDAAAVIRIFPSTDAEFESLVRRLV